MGAEQRLVTEFHQAFGIPIGSVPSIPDDATCVLRLRLLQQAHDDLQIALAQQDVVALAQALADVLYTAYGTAISCGIDMEPVFHEVHRSNMSKVGVHQRADGTWMKPTGYTPPTLQPILAAQHYTQPRTHQETLEPPITPHPAVLSRPAPPVGPSDTAPPSHLVPLEPLQTLPHTNGRAVTITRTLPHERSRMDERLQIQCPRCRKHFVRRSHRKGLYERLLSCLCRYPFRCQVCGRRFKAFQFRAHYTKQRIDRRQYERLPISMPVTFAEAVRPGELRTGTGHVLEISLGGCFVQTVIQLAEGTLVSLELQIETAAPPLLVEAALVRSVRPLGVGLEFLRLAETEQERLSSLMRRLHAEHEDADPAHD